MAKVENPKVTGELVILPPLGPSEKATLQAFLQANQESNKVAPSPWVPFGVSDKGIAWDWTLAPTENIVETAAHWLEHYVIPKFVKPLRHMSGQLVIEGVGTIIVSDNAVSTATWGDEPTFGTKKDGTPKAKPGPKPKTLKEIIAEKKVLGPSDEEVSDSPYNTTELEDFKQKVVELQAEIEKLKKPKKSKCPHGKRWVRLTVSKEIDKEKFVEGVKLTIMGVEEIEVFE